MQQIVKNTVSKLKKETEVGRHNFKRKNYYEQLKTQSISKVGAIGNPGRVIKGESFGQVAYGAGRGPLTAGRVMDLIRKNFEMSLSRSRSKRNNSLNQHLS